MQFEKANRLSKEWGIQPCDHPDFEKEYYLGSDTGDVVCTQCGRAFFERPRSQEKEKESDTKEKE